MSVEKTQEILIDELKDLDIAAKTGSPVFFPSWPRLPTPESQKKAILHLGKTKDQVTRVEKDWATHSPANVRRQKGLHERGDGGA
jgi:hypothetical protein